MHNPPVDNPQLRALSASDLPPDEGSGRGFAYEWERAAAQITQTLETTAADIAQQIADIDAGVAPTFRFEQASPVSVWTILHELGGFPSVLVMDSTGQELISEVHYPDDQTVVVTHGQPYSGIAYLRL